MDWDAFFNDASLKLSASRRVTIGDMLTESRRQLDRRNPAFFTYRMPASQQLRLLDEFRDRTAYLNIETTRLEANRSISTIAVYDSEMMANYGPTPYNAVRFAYMKNFG